MCSSFDRTLWPRNRETIDVSSFPSPPPFIYQFLPTCPLQNSPLFPHFPGIQKLERRAQLTEKQALSLNTTEVHKLINSANAVSARLNTATGEISRNPGGGREKIGGTGAILCDRDGLRGGWPISLRPTRQFRLYQWWWYTVIALKVKFVDNNGLEIVPFLIFSFRLYLLRFPSN